MTWLVFSSETNMIAFTISLKNHPYFGIVLIYVWYGKRYVCEMAWEKVAKRCKQNRKILKSGRKSNLNTASSAVLTFTYCMPHFICWKKNIILAFQGEAFCKAEEQRSHWLYHIHDCTYFCCQIRYTPYNESHLTLSENRKKISLISPLLFPIFLPWTQF